MPRIVILSAGEDGARGARAAFDPFGQPIDLADGSIGAPDATAEHHDRSDRWPDR